MKKLLSLFAFSFMAHSMGATDLYVNNSGQAGTYTTIQAAINAASTGDNIYVSPLNSYLETLSITKSLRITSSVSGSRIIITQDIKISPVANIQVELIGIEGTNVILDTQTSTLGPNSRGRAIITDCSFSSINLDVDYLTLIAVKCAISGNIIGRHGKVIGNTAGGITINDEPNIGIGDTVLVKANLVSGNIAVKTDDHSVIIQNNKCYRILISNWRSGVTISGLISNNSVISRETRYRQGSSYAQVVSDVFSLGYQSGCINIGVGASNQSITNMLITNNYIDDIGSYPLAWQYYQVGYCAIGISDNIPTNFPIVQYNIFDSNTWKNTQGVGNGSYHWYGFFWNWWPTAQKGVYNLQTNVGSSPDSQIISEGKDIGSPSPKFYDADLTRSDIGHLGGDNSFEMFHGANATSGAAYIISLNLPSEIWPGQTVNMKAQAVHTN
jgi:hypothetical protein